MFGRGIIVWWCFLKHLVFSGSNLNLQITEILIVRISVFCAHFRVSSAGPQVSVHCLLGSVCITAHAFKRP